MNEQEAVAVLTTLADANANRRNEIKQYGSDDETTDDKADGDCPELGAFFTSAGYSASISLTKFVASEFKYLGQQLTVR